jgi:GT2 family glycosyltransferase
VREVGLEETRSADEGGGAAALDPTLSAVVPVHNGRRFLESSLPALLRHVPSELMEVIVVDDSSTDGSGELADRLGARVLTSPRRLGPAAARNLGGDAARGSILFFVDADVVVHDDAMQRSAEAFGAGDIVAVFGSYDDVPPEPDFLSQYKNLVHHYVHQSSQEEASTFWAGCGAVRKDAFLAVGGFDADRYPRPSIEDIELGYRLRAAGGRIRVIRELQGTHLKRWGFRELLRTEIAGRAVPWSRLLLERPEAAPHLNVAYAERVRAAIAIGAASILGLALLGLAPAWSCVVAVGAAIVSSLRLFAFFRQRNGAGFALGATLFHQLYYLYSAGAYAWCWTEKRLGRRAKRTAVPASGGSHRSVDARE